MEEYIKLNTVSAYEKETLFSIALLTAIGCMYSPKMIAFLLPLMTLMMVWLEGGTKNISLKLSPPLFFLLLLLAWIGMSAFWAENQTAALKTFIQLNFTFLFSVLFLSCILKSTPNLISKAYRIVKYSGFFLILLIISQIYMDTFFGGFIDYKEQSAYMLRMKPTGSILGLTSFVGCGFLWVFKNKFVAIYMFLLLSLLVFLTQCQTATYGIIIGTVVFVLSYLMPFWVTRIGMIFSYTFLLLSPLFYNFLVPTSVALQSPFLKGLMCHSLFHRFISWEHYSKKFFQKPFLGWGAESSRYLQDDLQAPLGYEHLFHPHNNSIQAYAELGLVGGILFALFFSSLFYLVEKHVKDRLSIAICNSTLAFGFICAEMTHNAWRNYWLSLSTITAGLIILLIRAREAQLHEQADHLTQPPIQTKEWELQQSWNS